MTRLDIPLWAPLAPVVLIAMRERRRAGMRTRLCLPRAGRLITGCAAMLAMITVAAWIASEWRWGRGAWAPGVTLSDTDEYDVCLRRGAFAAAHYEPVLSTGLSLPFGAMDDVPAAGILSVVGRYFRTREWLPTVTSGVLTSGYWRVNVPLWIPFVVFASIAGVSGYRTRRAGRLAANACAKCGYDRAGLAPTAACPECGTANSVHCRQCSTTAGHPC